MSLQLFSKKLLKIFILTTRLSDKCPNNNNKTLLNMKQILISLNWCLFSYYNWVSKLHFFTFIHWSLRLCLKSAIIVTVFAVAGLDNRILCKSLLLHRQYINTSYMNKPEETKSYLLCYYPRVKAQFLGKKKSSRDCSWTKGLSKAGFNTWLYANPAVKPCRDSLLVFADQDWMRNGEITRQCASLTICLFFSISC